MNKVPVVTFERGTCQVCARSRYQNCSEHRASERGEPCVPPHVQPPFPKGSMNRGDCKSQTGQNQLLTLGNIDSSSISSSTNAGSCSTLSRNRCLKTSRCFSVSEFHHFWYSSLVTRVRVLRGVGGLVGP